jgi:hypothetical protein
MDEAQVAPRRDLLELRTGRFASAADVTAITVLLIALAVADAHRGGVRWVFDQARTLPVWFVVAVAIAGWLVGVASSIVYVRRAGRQT